MVALLLLVASLPSLLFYAGIASSLSLGTVVASIIIICAHILRGGSLGLRSEVAAVAFVASVFVTLAALTHLFAVGAIRPVDMGRALGTLASALIIFAAAGVVAQRLQSISSRRLERVAIQVWTSLLVVGLLGMTRYGPTLDKYFKAVPPFTEPSLFALAYLPWALAVACLATGHLRLSVIVGTAVLGIGLQNLTLLLVGTLLVAVACLRTRLLVPAAVLLALILVLIGGDYYLDRLIISDDESNLTVLAYLQGWQLAYDAWERTDGIGLGLQQLGVSGESEVSASQLILAILGEHMNLLDGGFVAAKLLAEFGVFGAALVTAYLFIAIGSLLWIRRTALREGPMRVATSSVLSRALIAAFFIDMFIRGTGYLTPSMLFFFAGLQMVLSDHLRNRKTPSPLNGRVSAETRRISLFQSP